MKSVIDETSDISNEPKPEKPTYASKSQQRMDNSLWLENMTSHTKDETSFWKLFLDNWLYVVTYCSVFGSFGVCVGVLGPTVFDLGCQTRSDLKKMNWVFFAQLFPTLVGSVWAGCMVSW